MSGLFAKLAVGVALLAASQSTTDRLLKPEALAERAPAVFRAVFDTSKGAFVIEVHRDWAPRGADRFYALVKNGFYDDCRFFRVIDGLTQVGISGQPAIQAAWARAMIPDDPIKEQNKAGFVAFAHAGRNTRSTQFIINLVDNSGSLDKKEYAPIGRVVSGMDVVESLYSGYGDGAPRGIGPSQSEIAAEGNAMLKAKFPKLDYVKKATIEK